MAIEYKKAKRRLEENLKNHHDITAHDHEAEFKEALYLLSQAIEVERDELMKLWHEEKITNAVKLKLLLQLDHRAKNFAK